MRIELVFTFLVLSAGAITAFAQPQESGPTFDCANASGQVETLICKDAGLAALDRRMAAVYAAAMKTWPADIAAKQRAYQRGWIRGRNDCWKAHDQRGCVDASYRTRIVQLQIQSGQLMAPTPVGYACTGAENKPFVVTFYPETDPPSAVITYGNDQVIAFRAPSGSGATYAATNMAFWEHQGEAAVDWYGTKLRCKLRAAAQAAAPQTQRTPLGGTAWQLVQFQSMDDTTLTPESSALYTIAFDPDGRLRVRADCNRGQGTWRSPDNVTLELKQLALTRALCPSVLYDRFVRDLEDVRSYIMHDGNLYLSLKIDGGIYAFKPVEQP